MAETYRNRDVEAFFRCELVSEVRRAFTYPVSMQIAQKVSNEYGASVTLGFGDMFNRLKDGGLGHTKEYTEFKAGLGKRGKKISEETYNQRTEDIRSLFSRRSLRDVDVGFVFHDDLDQDKESLTTKLKSSLNQHLREAIQQKSFLKNVMNEKFPFNGFDLYPICVLKEKEFADMLAYQNSVASAFPYGLNMSVTSLGSEGKPINFKEVEAGTLPQGVRIYMDPSIRVTVTSVQTPPASDGVRKAMITVEPSVKLAEPYLDVLQKGRGAIIHCKDVGKVLEGMINDYRRLTGLPRDLQSQNKLFEEYTRDISRIGLGREVEDAAKEALKSLNELSTNCTAPSVEAS